LCHARKRRGSQQGVDQRLGSQRTNATLRMGTQSTHCKKLAGHSHPDMASITRNNRPGHEFLSKKYPRPACKTASSENSFWWKENNLILIRMLTIFIVKVMQETGQSWKVYQKNLKKNRFLALIRA
jgi:hypothetical protein